jgi:O-antigen/teichoic acid export membrane protein
MSNSTIVRNTAYMYVGEFTSKIFQFIFIILLTRYLGAEGFGKISFALAFGYIIATIADLGINNILFREMATNVKSIPHHISRAFSIKMMIGTIITLLILAVIPFFGFSIEKIIIVFTICVSLIIDSLSQILRLAIISRKKMAYESVIKVIFNLSKLLLFLVLFYINAGILLMASIYLISSVVTFVISLTIYQNRIGTISFNFDSSYFRWLIAKSYPMLITTLLLMLLFNMDVVILSFIKGDHITGIYSAPSRLIMNGFVISEVLIISLYPSLAEYYKNRKSLFTKTIETATSLIFIVFTPIFIGCMIFSDKIILLLFGKDFVSGAILLPIFSLILFLYFIIALYANLFVIAKKVKVFMYASLISTVISSLLYYFLIDKYSYLGAGIGALASYSILALLFHVAYRYNPDINLKIALLRPLMVFIVLLIISYFLRNLPYPIFIIIFIPLYLVSIFFFGLTSLKKLYSLFKLKE